MAGFSFCPVIWNKNLNFNSTITEYKNDTMDKQQLQFLCQAEIQTVLSELAQQKIDGPDELKIIKKLRRRFNSNETSLLLNQVKLRGKGANKFPAPMAANMFYEEKALEQATSWPLAMHRAQKLHQAASLSEAPFLDLGCGIGGDALAMAHFRPVIAVDLDRERLDILEVNAARLQLPFPIYTLQADYMHDQLPEAAAAFSDPARRQNDRRIYNPLETLPPLPQVVDLLRRLAIPAAIKLSPSFNKEMMEQLKPASLEFTGPSRQCREAVLWLNLPNNPFLEASIYLKENIWHTERHPLEQNNQVEVGELREGQYLYEVEPVLLRSGLLHTYADKLQAHLFDPSTSWLVSDYFTSEPLAEAFLLEEIHKFSLKKLQKRIKELEIGIIEIKKRNFAVEPETIRQKIKTCRTSNSLTVFLTRRSGEPLFMLGRRMERI
ncbi:MAG: hypothetical protein ACI376_06730 [Candidatus Bruticola sp.]